MPPQIAPAGFPKSARGGVAAVQDHAEKCSADAALARRYHPQAPHRGQQGRLLLLLDC